MPPPARRLTDAEIAALLALDVPARLATLDPDRLPRITPLWFVWEDGAFWMTSLECQPHVRNLRADARAAVCVDTEDQVSVGGVRPNRQAKGKTVAGVGRDEGGEWTRRITLKYVRGAEGAERAALRASQPRVVIRLRPVRLLAIGS